MWIMFHSLPNNALGPLKRRDLMQNQGMWQAINSIVSQWGPILPISWEFLSNMLQSLKMVHFHFTLCLRIHQSQNEFLFFTIRPLDNFQGPSTFHSDGFQFVYTTTLKVGLVNIAASKKTCFANSIILHTSLGLVGCSKTKVQLIVDTNFHQQSLAVVLHLKSELLTTYVAGFGWLPYSGLIHKPPLGLFPHG